MPKNWRSFFTVCLILAATGATPAKSERYQYTADELVDIYYDGTPGAKLLATAYIRGVAEGIAFLSSVFPAHLRADAIVCLPENYSGFGELELIDTLKRVLAKRKTKPKEVLPLSAPGVLLLGLSEKYPCTTTNLQ